MRRRGRGAVSRDRARALALRGLAALALTGLGACEGRAPEPSARATAPPRAAPADPGSPARQAMPPLRAVTRDRLCVSLGAPRAASTGWWIDDPKLRATFAGSRGRAAEIQFRYGGTSAHTAPLRSGQQRRQLGLELSARDTCNLIYVMWRIDPVAELVVSIKQNPGQSRHAECENGGYRRIAPSEAAPLPRLEPGGVHRLEARLTGDSLDVLVDGQRRWRGRLDAGALALSGRSGLRSDNVRFELVAAAADLGETAEPCR